MAIQLWALAGGVIPQMTTRSMQTLLVATFAIILVNKASARESNQPAVQMQILLTASSSWDGEPYDAYPSGQPEISILKITIPPRTKLAWHSHPMPNAAYIVTGELTIERKKDGKRRHFTAGQALPETVGTLHRGISGNEPVVLIVFYAGSRGVPLTQRLIPTKSDSAFFMARFGPRLWRARFVSRFATNSNSKRICRNPHRSHSFPDDLMHPSA